MFGCYDKILTDVTIVDHELLHPEWRRIMKKKIKDYLKDILFPSVTDDLIHEIDALNLKSLQVISLLACIFEVIGIFLLLAGLSSTTSFSRSFFSVTFCILVCIITFIVTKIMLKKPKIRHGLVMVFICGVLFLLTGWGMWVSYYHYLKGEQILTYYTIVIVQICFLNIRPIPGIIMTIASFMIYYVWLYQVDQAVNLQVFNYFSFAAICEVASVSRYHIVLRQLRDKKEITRLNESLKDDIRTASDQMMAKELELSHMKIKIMQNQISPHFIFNGLSVIKSLIWEDREKAEESVTEFSMYLRRNIEALRSTDMILFSKELEHIKAFLAIEQADENMCLEIEFDLQAQDFPVPPLSVEPLVENAVIHGVSKRSGQGKIRITTKEEENRFVIIVADNGPGFDLTAKRKGVGIENVRSRLKYQCNGMLELTASRAGTIATITIPKTEGTYENSGVG